MDEIHASHIVEHVDDLMSFMGEVWRICKPETLVYFRFPHGSTKFMTWKDPTHKRAVFLATFEYFDPNTFDGAAFGYYHPAKFRIMGRLLNFNMNADTLRLRKARRMLARVFDGIANRDQRSQYAAERFWGQLVGFEEAHIWLRAIKPD